MDAGKPADGVKAYQAAYQKYPQYAGRHRLWWKLTKGDLPPDLRKFLREPDTKADAEAVKDASARALTRLRQEGLSIDTPQGLKRFDELEKTEAERLQKITETPGQEVVRKLNQRRLEIAEGKVAPSLGEVRRSYGEAVEHLRAATQAGDEEGEQIARQNATFFGRLMQQMGQKEAEKAGLKPDDKDKGKKATLPPGVTITKPPAAPTEAAALAEAKRLRALKKFADDAAIVQAMKAAGWPVE